MIKKSKINIVDENAEKSKITFNLNKFLRKDLNNLIKNIDSKYGFLISINNKIIYEKYSGNNKKTRFRIFSCSKPITGLAIILLVQMNKLKLTDTLDKYCINIPYNNKITILHLLCHSSGIYDFTSELYFHLKPLELFNNIIDNNNTKFIEFETMIDIINKNKSYFKPLKKADEKYIHSNYNNTGYDILGYIIYLASGMKTDQFIKNYIFDKLNMKDSGFQHDKHKDESIPYEKNGKIGIKEEQNWFCGNAYITCTLRDYNKFMSNYANLLRPKYKKIYEKLYYFYKEDNKYQFTHPGSGDFSHLHAECKEDYKALSKTIMCKYINQNINIIISENYSNENGFFKGTPKNWIQVMNIIDIYFNK